MTAPRETGPESMPADLDTPPDPDSLAVEPDEIPTDDPEENIVPEAFG
jgi:hypothetical protein